MDRRKNHNDDNHGKSQYSRDIKKEDSRDKNRRDDVDKREWKNDKGRGRDNRNEKDIKYEYGLQNNDKKKDKEVIKKEEPSLVVSGNLAKGNK